MVLTVARYARCRGAGERVEDAADCGTVSLRRWTGTRKRTLALLLLSSDSGRGEGGDEDGLGVEVHGVRREIRRRMVGEEITLARGPALLYGSRGK